jgi:hypothetical protein
MSGGSINGRRILMLLHLLHKPHHSHEHRISILRRLKKLRRSCSHTSHLLRIKHHFVLLKDPINLLGNMVTSCIKAQSTLSLFFIIDIKWCNGPGFEGCSSLSLLIIVIITVLAFSLSDELICIECWVIILIH